MSSSITIRHITDESFSAWRELRLRALRDHPDAFGQPYAAFAAIPPDVALGQFQAHREIGTVILGAFNENEGDRLVGIVRLTREDGAYDAHRMGLYGMYVLPEARGTGTADALVEAAIAESRSTDGVLQIQLAVASHSQPACRLYRRHGFVRYGTEPRALMVNGVAYDEDLMALMLDTQREPDTARHHHHRPEASSKRDDVTIAAITDETFPLWRARRLQALHDHPDAFGEPYASYAAISEADALSQFQDRREQGTVILGSFERDGTLTGMIGLYRQQGSRSQHRLGLWGMYVAPEARGSGVSDALVDAAITEARTVEGILQINLSVTSTNLAARKLYERHGFMTWGTEPRFEILDGEAKDLDQMVLHLDKSEGETH